MTEVRQRTQQEVVGHRGRKGDSLYGIRHTLLRGRERLSQRDQERIEAALGDPRGDRFEEVACAWVAKELVRDVYRAEGLSEARQGLGELYAWAEEVAVPEVIAWRTPSGAGSPRSSTTTGPACRTG
ncbi:MAG: transposase [Actinomycetota bacterium]|nr:transposase [Actinomycetota bacterium]